MRQADIFLRSEADRWFERNRAGLGSHDPVSTMIETAKITPESVLEIGCANGWRLAALNNKYGCKVVGIEPGRKAAMEAGASKVPVFDGATATALPITGQTHDVVIYGFCLYLTDPAEWFKIVAEGDRVLKTGGHLIIHDFAAYSEYAFARKYEHCDGVIAYHVDFASFWLANPLYRIVERAIYPDDQMVTLLKKNPKEMIEVVP